LNEGLDLNRLVTLVSAPAGYGKTTCISQWLNDLERWPVTWLSLEPADNDPGRFFTYLIAALQKVDVNLGQEIEDVLHSGQVPPGEVLSTTLINDIMELEGRFLLILDDFHVIQDSLILEVLQRFITNPPQALHLVLLTREDPPLPLALLRARNLLTEIRAQDLRFTGQETVHFLDEMMELSLSETDIAELEEKTEGWIVGLQLAGLSVRDRANPSEFIAGLAGSHRFILSYLTEQVLAQQPEMIQEFLLQTSILNTLNGDLCNEVTQRSDSHELLEQLYNANLFLIPLDDERRWYRYHHLFGDLLRELQKSLMEDKTVELHRRASHWYARAGMASEAIQHTLAAKDYATAVDLLESHAMEMIMNGYAKTVNAWVDAIPDKMASQSPKTNLAFAWMHLLRGTSSQASPHLELVKTHFEGSRGKPQPGDKDSLMAEWLVMQSLLLNMQGHTDRSKTLAVQALEMTPDEDVRVRSLANYALAVGWRNLGNDAQANETYQEAIRLGQMADNLVAEMLSTAGLAVMAFEHGQLHLAFEILDPVSSRVARSGSPPPVSTVIFGLLGQIYTQWNQVDQARHHILRALRLSNLGGYKSGMVNCHVLLSRLYQIEEDLATAAREIQAADDLMQTDAPDYVRQEAIAQQVNLYIARDRPAAAEMALQREGFSFRERFAFPILPPDESFSHYLGLLYNSSLQVLLHRARTRGLLTDLESGIDLAGQLIARALQNQYMLVALETLLLRAQMHKILDHQPSSQKDYLRALELAEPEGVIGVFIQQGLPVAEALATLVKQGQLEAFQSDYLERVLAALSRSLAPAITPDHPTDTDRPDGAPTAVLIEPLTDRELDVVGLMAEGLTYKAIADRLFVSLNTVRFHVKAIYSKLGVNNRTQAIEKVRKLQIL
jgi:LuxR family maltose regulon positive regulatory protein